jgi:hypothetical protein
MGLYPTTLFHFTSKKALYAILSDAFMVSYAREQIISPTRQLCFAVPMVSFCDLRLTELKSFIRQYGDFGIGMTKEWANKSGLNPVWYVSRHAPVIDDLMAGVETLFDLSQESDDEHLDERIAVAYTSTLNAYRFTKNYQGQLVRGGKLINADHRYAEEREWRFVPDYEANIVPIVNAGYMKTAQEKKNLNKRAAHIKLSFGPDDIKYLVVKSDKDILPLIEHLRVVKSKFSLDMVNRLTSRILTAEQIRDDV